ncbi:hypothetical protein GWI34_00940 [Actinomadura sp. DSM 109109]|nr:hypothetical protein [Actinomadura lepetitiana]
MSAEWVSVHVYAHADLDVQVVPLAGLLSSVANSVDARAWFFLRYWDGGPHVRLRLLCESERARLAAHDLLRGGIADWRRNNPGPGALSSGEYQRTVAWVLRREAPTRPPGPLRADRSHHLEPFSGAWSPGGPRPDSRPEALRFLSGSSGVALAALRGADWSARFRHAVDVLRVLAGSFDDAERTLGDWARRLADDRIGEVEERCAARRRSAAGWGEPDRTAAAVAHLCLGTGAGKLQAWHTHCNRLGLNLLEESAAATLAVMP